VAFRDAWVQVSLGLVAWYVTMLPFVLLIGSPLIRAVASAFPGLVSDKVRSSTLKSELPRRSFARGLGLEPEKVLIQSEFSEPHRIYSTTEEREEAQTRILSVAVKELIKKELLASEKFPNPTNSLDQAQRDGGPDGIHHLAPCEVRILWTRRCVTFMKAESWTQRNSPLAENSLGLAS